MNPQYGQHGKAFVLPGLHWPEVVLPPSHVAWLASQPESVLSDDVVQDELLGLRYFSGGPNAAAVHDFSIIRRELTRHLARVLPAVLDEVKTAVQEGFGDDTEQWKEVEAFKIMPQVVEKAVERAFVGMPLCRDASHLAGMRRWQVAFSLCGAIYRYLSPDCLKPVLAPVSAALMALVNWWGFRRALPMIRQRIADLEARERFGNTDRRDDHTPEDLLQWLVESNAHKPESQRLSAWHIANRLAFFELVSVHTTSSTLGASLLNILSHPSASHILAELREEADTYLPQLTSDPTMVRAMMKHDSVIRETLRIDTMFAHGMTRRVMPEQGITTPDGLWLPQGCHVAALVIPPQQAQFEDGEVWEPFRFYRLANGVAAAAAAAAADDTRGRCDLVGDIRSEERIPLLQTPTKQTTAVQISPSFLSFGLGKHACPGRFFAVQTMKLILSYMISHYDFEPLGPEGEGEGEKRYLEITEVRLPNPNVKIKVQRRTDGRAF